MLNARGKERTVPKSRDMINNFKILERLLKPARIHNRRHFRPVKGFSIDSRTIKKGEAFVALKGKFHDGHDFIREAVKRGCSLVVAEKQLPVKPEVTFFAVKDVRHSLKSIATHLRKKKNPFVYGITGSVGKTTTKEMLAFLLEPHGRSLKNNKTENNILGVAKTIFSLRDEKTMVLELGTNSKGEIETLAEMSRPNIGIITFIKLVHLAGLKDLRSILAEKVSLFKASSRTKAVFNGDDPYLLKFGPPALAQVKGSRSGLKRKPKIYWFGKGKHNDLFYRLRERKDGQSTFIIQDKYPLVLPSYREGFIANAAASILGAHLLGIPLSESVGRMNSFRNFPPMRMQMQKRGRFLILNDAYNSNPYSFEQAVNSLRNYSLKKTIVVGDMLELSQKSIYYHRRMAPQIIRAGFDYCLTFGRFTSYLNESLKNAGYKKAFHFQSHKGIARFIHKNIKDRLSQERHLIFLKGSRKMELEKVLNYL